MYLFRYRHVLVATTLVLFLFANIASYASDQEAQGQYLELSAGVSHGEFDAGQDVNLSRLQLDYGQINEQFDFSVSLPYYFLSDDVGDEHGLGDVILRGGISLAGNEALQNSLYGSVAVKVALADEEKGLGTGENDLGVFLRYQQRFEDYNASLMGGFILTGDSSNQNYEDIFVYGAGLSRQVIPWLVYVSLEGRQRVLDDGDNPLEIIGGFFYQVEADQFLHLQGYQDLANESGYGVTLGWVNWF